MKVFDLFKRKVQMEDPPKGDAVAPSSIITEDSPEVQEPEIPEHVFIENENQQRPKPMDLNEEQSTVNDLNSLYTFLEQNLEKRGYEDALVNPDTSYMDENSKFIRCELDLVISKVKTYYSSHLKTVNFHIETRRRNGMIETVEELLSHKDSIDEEIKVVHEIETDAKSGVGLSQNLILSYRKGFRNGFAAITYNTVLGKIK